MRSIPALLLLALAAPAAAQPVVNGFAFPEAPALPLPSLAAQDSVIADTTEPWRYFPLQQGNVWEYRHGEYNYYNPGGVLRHEITGDTLIGQRRYVLFHESDYDEAGNRLFSLTQFVRYDSTERRGLMLMSSGEEPHWLTPCPLDAPFGAYVDCGLGFRFVLGGYDAYLVFGGETTSAAGDTVRVDAWKSFGSSGSRLLAAGFGLTYNVTLNGNEYALRYARIDGVEYGYPLTVPVSAPEQPRVSALAIRRLYPNPVRVRVRLDYSAPPSATLTLSVYDALGRRVLMRSLAAGGERASVEASALAPGVYVARLCAAAGAGCAATRFVRVR